MRAARIRSDEVRLFAAHALSCEAELFYDVIHSSRVSGVFNTFFGITIAAKLRYRVCVCPTLKKLFELQFDGDRKF